MMGKVTRLMIVVDARLDTRNLSTLSLSNLFSALNHFILPIFATTKELRAHPSIAKNERRRLTENAE